VIYEFINAMGVPAAIRRLGDRFGADRRRPWKLGRRHAQSLLVLPYHRVGPTPDDLLMAPVHPDVFAAQMAHLTRHYSVLPLEEAIDRLFDGSLPARAIAITFDDGYRDNLQHALPILKRYGAPATIFLATDFIGTDRVPPHDEIARLVKHADARSGHLRWGVETAEFRFDTAPAREAAIGRLTGWLRAADADETPTLITTLRDITKAVLPNSESPAMLSWSEVRSMADGLIAFGSHGRSHVACGRLTREQLTAELSGAQAIIERELGRRARLFAYPFGKPGDIGPLAHNAVEQAGHDYALTTVDAVAGRASNRLAIPRGGPVWETRPAAFALRLAWRHLAAE
jgi:peptidoglycan/xylan/chitin deacetylase (PgdA/CDA1 family)